MSFWHYMTKDRGGLRAYMWIASSTFVLLFGLLFDPNYMMLATVPLAVLLGLCNEHLCDFLAAMFAGVHKRGG